MKRGRRSHFEKFKKDIFHEMRLLVSPPSHDCHTRSVPPLVNHSPSILPLILFWKFTLYVMVCRMQMFMLLTIYFSQLKLVMEIVPRECAVMVILEDPRRTGLIVMLRSKKVLM